MADIKTVSVRLQAINDQFKKEMKASGDASHAFGAASTVALAAVGTAAVAFAIKSANAYVEYGRSIMGLSRVSGENIEMSSRLAFAGKMAGVSVDTLSTSFRFLQKNMAADKDIFKEIGVSVKDNNGHFRSAGAVFLDVADKVSKLGSTTEKVDAIQKIFGRNGMALAPLLMKGSAAIRQLMEDAQKYGMVLTNENAAAIKENVDAHRKLDAAMQGLQMRIGAEVLPALTKMTELFSSLPGPIMENIAPITGVTVGLLALVTVGPKVKDAFTKVSEVMKGMSGTQAVATAGVAAAILVYVEYSKTLGELSKTMGETQDKKRAAASYDEITSSLGRQRTELAHLRDEGKNATWFWDRTAANAAGDELDKIIKKSEEYQTMIDEIAGSTGKSTEEVTAWLRAQAGAGNTYDKSSVAISALTGKIDINAMSTEDATAAIKGFDDATKALNDTERAALDPQFAIIDARRKLTDAQRKSTEAQWKIVAATKAVKDAEAIWGKNSDAAKIAQLELNAAKEESVVASEDVAKANMDMDSSVRNLQNAFATHRASVETTSATLKAWVDQGRLTQKQADDIARSIGLIKIETDNLDGTYTTVYVDVVQKTISLSADQQARRTTHEAELGRHANGGVMDQGWNLVGEQGPELVHRSGRVMTAAQTSHITSGSTASSSVVVNFPNYVGDKRELTRLISDSLGRLQRGTAA